MQWYYVLNGQRLGPIADDVFREHVQTGVIKADTLVWREGMAEWQPYGAVSSPLTVAPHVNSTGPDHGPGSHFEYAHFGRRLVAKVIDIIILSMIGTAVNLALGAVLYGSIAGFGSSGSQVSMTMLILFQVMSTLVNVGLGLIYSVYFVRQYSATPGKMVLGLKLFRADGSPLSVGRIIGRFFAEWLSGMILLIGYIMAAFDDESRTLHDRICETRVMKSP